MGLVLCEIQQYSDVTYRLFDYKRQPERPLHLEDSLAVALPGPLRIAPSFCFVDCKYFRTERLCVQGKHVRPTAVQPFIYVALEGEGNIAGEPFRAGEAVACPCRNTRNFGSNLPMQTGPSSS